MAMHSAKHRELYEVAGMLVDAQPEEIVAILECDPPRPYAEYIVIAMHLRKYGGDHETVRAYATQQHPERLPIDQQRQLPEYKLLTESASESDKTLIELRVKHNHDAARAAIHSTAQAVGLVLGRSLHDAESAAAPYLLQYCNHWWVTCIAGAIRVAIVTAIAIKG